LKVEVEDNKMKKSVKVGLKIKSETGEISHGAGGL